MCYWGAIAHYKQIETKTMSSTQTETVQVPFARPTMLTTSTPAGECPFLDLPYEIRQQIYSWVHLMHPIQHAQLAPWYPTPIYSSYFLKLIKPEGDAEEVTIEDKGTSQLVAGSNEEHNRDDKKDEDLLLSPHRPVCGLPSSLLRTNRQIYAECSMLPFRTNEFVFVNWFSSGLWAARAFTRGLKPWQRDEMRYARLEMLGRDFTSPTLKEWIDLCGCWTNGLRGLRLKILIGGGIFEPAATFAALNNNAEAQAMDISHFPDPKPEWIEEGLRKLRALKQIEVELTVLDWDDAQKLEWCGALEAILNEEREEGQKVIVRCVERLMEDRGPRKSAAREGQKEEPYGY
ncbi:uncharacterized protein CTRU02_209679 [Colletotrichum truncatum]|uniref:Uncharacterized protein n=1 Tax=Colletotrichum truncatum TaxID=5467 RepID=A0ACC3YT15_COLTU|nr:uncharacterized protein CTRU02_12020 [Colletotrichum truncatum]KAF6785088.1 hypothetical protein CTRU02_12020 [Colletotrichum truncatum]